MAHVTNLATRTSRSAPFLVIISCVAVALALLGCADTDDGNAPQASANQDETPGNCELPGPPEPYIDALEEGQLANVGWDGANQPVIVPPAALPDGYRIEPFACVGEIASSMAFAPDGRLFVAKQFDGQLLVVEPDGTVQPEPFASVDAHSGSQELGLVGVAVHPAYPNPAYVYLYYVAAREDQNEPAHGVLMRYVDDGGVGADGEELGEFPGPKAGASIHAGGSLVFGPDGKLYLTLGDTSTPELAQDLGSPAGSILRMNDDGTVPDDGPLAETEGADPLIYAYGFRNPFDIAYHPDLEAWVGTDNAPEEFDELNVIEAGGNYGHPLARGFVVSEDDPPDDIDPIWVYLLNSGPAGIDVYTGDRLTEFRGDVFFCQFHREGLLHRVRISEDRTLVSDTVLSHRCSSDVVEGPDGFLYFMNGQAGIIYRIVDTPAQ